MSGIEIPAGVGWTALLTAYGRAQESRGEEGLFSDPFAAMFINAVGGAATAGSDDLPRLGPAVDDGSSTLWNAWRFYFSQRTPFYDQRILEAVKDGCEQVVLLAAGLDSRAFRLGLAENVTVFELDQPAVLNFKEAVLSRHGASPTCQRIPLATDLRADWPEVLRTARFDASLRTAWVAEGLLMYLSRSDADQLLARVTTLSAPGSRFATEYFSRAWHDADVANDTLDAQDWAAWNAVRQAFLYGPMDDSPEDWLAGNHWTRGEITTLAALGNRNHRPVPPEFARPGAPQVWLLEGLHKGRVP